MQVILVKSVRKLGRVGETVDVAHGYGRNYLIPQEFAIRASRENIEKFSAIQKELEDKNSDNKQSAEIAAKKLEGKHINFITQSAADGRLFGSVSAKSLAVEISKLADVSLNYNNVLLAAPIKFNGVYNVEVSLHPDVTTTILVVVAKTEPEAQDALIEYKEGGSKKEAEARAKEEQYIFEANAAEEARNAANLALDDDLEE